MRASSSTAQAAARSAPEDGPVDPHQALVAVVDLGAALLGFGEQRLRHFDAPFSFGPVAFERLGAGLLPDVFGGGLVVASPGDAEPPAPVEGDVVLCSGRRVSGLEPGRSVSGWRGGFFVAEQADGGEQCGDRGTVDFHGLVLDRKQSVGQGTAAERRGGAEQQVPSVVVDDCPFGGDKSDKQAGGFQSGFEPGPLLRGEMVGEVDRAVEGNAGVSVPWAVAQAGRGAVTAVSSARRSASSASSAARSCSSLRAASRVWRTWASGSTTAWASWSTVSGRSADRTRKFVERRLDALFQSVQRPFDVDVVRGSGAQGVAPFTDGGSVVAAGFADLVDGGAFPFRACSTWLSAHSASLVRSASGRSAASSSRALVEVVDEGFALGGGSVGVGEPVVEVGEPSPQRVYLESLHRGRSTACSSPSRLTWVTLSRGRG